jgi:hypothetical protein
MEVQSTQGKKELSQEQEIQTKEQRMKDIREILERIKQGVELCRKAISDPTRPDVTKELNELDTRVVIVNGLVLTQIEPERKKLEVTRANLKSLLEEQIKETEESSDSINKDSIEMLVGSIKAIQETTDLGLPPHFIEDLTQSILKEKSEPEKKPEAVVPIQPQPTKAEYWLSRFNPFNLLSSSNTTAQQQEVKASRSEPKTVPQTLDTKILLGQLKEKLNAKLSETEGVLTENKGIVDELAIMTGETKQLKQLEEEKQKQIEATQQLTERLKKNQLEILNEVDETLLRLKTKLDNYNKVYLFFSRIFHPSGYKEYKQNKKSIEESLKEHSKFSQILENFSVTQEKTPEASEKKFKDLITISKDVQTKLVVPVEKLEQDLGVKSKIS